MNLPLAERLRPCGPIADPAYAERLGEALREAAEADGWSDLLANAWGALAPVFGASPYLASLVRLRPGRLAALLSADPDERLADILDRTRRLGAEADVEAAAPALRGLKAELHLLTAICDLGGVWSLEPVVEALSAFADAAVEAALAIVAQEERERGRLLAAGDGGGPAPGLFILAMGKHGGRELNYSSDIDISVFFDPEELPAAPSVEPQTLANRIAQGLARLLSDRTREGYVFRVDLRLRPDPAATPPAVSAPAAFEYYQAVGQNWERAAYIKARPCAGDIAAGAAFLKALSPFVWRRSLDYAAIADVHSIKRQIHVHKTDERLTAPGADLKLGAGGIREIEFFVQTQQLILGGRDPTLRSPRTLEALRALAEAGHVSPRAAAELAQAYASLRGLEHRIQMIADEQTHRLPEAAAERRRVAALAGEGDLRRFDAGVSKILKAVNRRYGELFQEEEPLSSRFGSLVFTGVDDDPETLRTLARMGFSNPAQVSQTIRAWHHGRIPATRPERGRELFTRLAPRLLEAAHATGAPDAAFTRFASFFSALAAGVQLQSLLLAKPALLELLVRILAFAPGLARTLARQPAAVDALLDPAFFAPFEEGRGEEAVRAAARGADGFEATMDAVRRVKHEQMFRIGAQVLSGSAAAADAGRAYADLADLCVQALAPAALTETVRIAGEFPGAVAVVGLGKFGGQEMTATSDLDLMVVYDAADPTAGSSIKGWSADTFFARFTQRLIAALSSPTSQGGLYEIDMRLRPSGSKGPVAVSLSAFERYYREEAETWELMALTRARVVWSAPEAFGAKAAGAVEAALRRPRSSRRVLVDVREMRALMETERPPAGPWDLKLTAGGFVDIEFAAQALQLSHAPEGGPIRSNTRAALAALAREAPDAGRLAEAFAMQHDLALVLGAALEGAPPVDEPAAFKNLLARAGGARTYPALVKRLAKVQAEAAAAARRVFGGVSTDFPTSDV